MCKTCSKCKVTYEIVEDNFGKLKDGYNKRCKKCSCEANKKYRLNNKDKVKERKKAYNTTNSEKVKRWHRNRKSQKYDKDKYNSEIYKDFYERNRELIIEQRRNRRKLLSDSYVKQVVKYSKSVFIENPDQEYLDKVKSIILLRREKIDFINRIKKELNIKSL